MAGRKRQESRKNSLEAIELKIEKAKERVIKTKEAHESAVKELKELMDKRDLLRQDALLKLLTTSKRSYEEIAAFLSSGTGENE